MKTSYYKYPIFFLLCTLLISSGIISQAQQENEDYVPQVGQAGKDVVWVPTPQTLVDRMLELARVTPQDYVIDLGSGDGRTVISAAKIGATAIGIEYNAEMVTLSRKNALHAKVSDKATFLEADLFDVDLSEATVITMFLLPDINLRLRPVLLDLKPGTRIVSNTFTMQDWVADETVHLEENCNDWCTALLWIVPAKIAGKWTMKEGELSLSQEFQIIKGNLTSDQQRFPIVNGRIKGYEITFSAGGIQYTGTIKDDVITGSAVENEKSFTWTAHRVTN